VDVNPEKLHAELKAAGIPVVSVTSEGEYQLARALTDEEKAIAIQVVKAHTPYTQEEEIEQEAEKRGISQRTILKALWRAVVESDNTQTEWIQSIKAQIAAEIAARQA
jgi:hypothetical protein